MWVSPTCAANENFVGWWNRKFAHVGYSVLVLVLPQLIYGHNNSARIVFVENIDAEISWSAFIAILCVKLHEILCLSFFSVIIHFMPPRFNGIKNPSDHEINTLETSSWNPIKQNQHLKCAFDFQYLNNTFCSILFLNINSSLYMLIIAF